MQTVYYDHPVLWSEERKRLEERKIAQDSLRDWHTRQEYKKAQLRRDREQYTRMIVEHNPWGRPGGGAPNREVRIKNLAVEGLYPESGQDCRNIPPSFRYRPNKAGGGGGAPIRSASGRLLLNYCEDPILGFNEPTRNYVDIELRYKTSARKKKHYKAQLDSLIAEKERDKATKKRTSIDVDRRLHLVREPWGRPGPGGNPWRPPRSVGNKFLESLGWTSTNDMQWMDRQTNKPHHPEHVPKFRNPSHDHGHAAHKPHHPDHVPKFPHPHPPLHEHSNVTDSEKLQNPEEYKPQRHIIPEQHIIPENCCTKCTCSSSKRYAHETGNLNPVCEEFEQHKSKKQQCHKKSNPQLYRHASRNCIVSPKARPCMITGGVELVPLLAKRRGDYRSTSLSTTDVTRHKDGKGDWKDCGVQYLNDLNRQIACRERTSQIQHHDDVESSKRHFETWNTFWGRPGHGAPRPIKNKLNLDDLLYKQPLK